MTTMTTAATTSHEPNRRRPLRPGTSEAVPVWVRDPSDPDGLAGCWRLVDPDDPRVDLRRAAQARLLRRVSRGSAA